MKRKENDRNQTSRELCSMLIFRGVHASPFTKAEAPWFAMPHRRMLLGSVASTARRSCRCRAVLDDGDWIKVVMPLSTAQHLGDGKKHVISQTLLTYSKIYRVMLFSVFHTQKKTTTENSWLFFWKLLRHK